MIRKGISVFSMLSLAALVPSCGFAGDTKWPEKRNQIKTINPTKKEEPMNFYTVKETTFIPLNAVPGQEAVLEHFLKEGARVVKGTEPLTLQWLALRQESGKVAIIDFFASDEGRKAHFSGKVAAALNQNASALVEGGWEKGVVPHIQNAGVLSSLIRPLKDSQVKIATRITLKARAGKEETLAEFLTGGAALVKETEPGTLLWYAIRISEDTFAIFDVFADEAGRTAHFSGKVAAALKEKAPDLVEGGWDGGVLKNVTHYDVLAGTFR